MKVLRKAIASLVVVSFIFSVTACNNPQKGPDPSKAPVSSEGPSEITYGGLTPMKDADKPITFNVFLRDPGQAPAKDNPVIKKITELTGVTLNFEFLVGDLNQKVGVMIAGEDYPDVIFGENAKFFDAGALLPLEDLIPKYPNLKKHYEKHMDKMIAGFDGKHAYTLENYTLVHYPAPIFFNTGAGFYIQKAVLEDSGYKIPKTIDEYFELIENYKKKYPTIDGAKTIGFEILCDGWRDFCLRNPAQHLMGTGNEGDVYVDPKTYVASLYQISDTAKNYYKKLNEEYHKGIIEGETFTENYDQYLARLSSGAVLGMFDQWWNYNTAENALKSAGKDNRTYVSVPLTNPGVQDGYLDATSESITGTGGLSITKNCKDPERLLAFYDWLLQREVQDYLQWGEEGKDWNKVGENGKVLTSERREMLKDTAKKRDLTGDTLWQYTPKMQGLYEDGSPCGPGDSADEYMAGLTAYDQKFLKDLNIQYPAQLLSPPVKRPKYYPTWSFPIEDGSPAKTAKTKLEDVCRRYYPQLIMTPSNQFDAMWDKFLADIKAGNIQPFVDEMNRQIKIRQGLE
ncbi:MAG: extracellular solute-binding protein [Clostridiaceae bacterium]|nr:extracellular solute-binding protein [Clostridiaceae bacterium]